MNAIHDDARAVPAPSLPMRTVMRETLWADGRGWRLTGATIGLMLHQAAEAAVPVMIGVTIDRAIAPVDPAALAWCLTVLLGIFVILSLSYQGASSLMVGVYGYGEHALRQRTLRRVLHPRASAVARRPGEVLSITTSDTYRVAGVSWSIAQQGATLAAVVFSAVALIFISAPLGIGVLLGAGLVLWLMQVVARPLERIGMAEQASVAQASDVAADAFAGLRVIRGLGAQDEITRRYRTASLASRDGAIAAARSVLGYNAISASISVFYLAVLAVAAAIMAASGTISPGQLVTVVGLAQFLQSSLAHVGTFGANWAHKRASARRLHDVLAAPYAIEPAECERATATTGLGGEPRDPGSPPDERGCDGMLLRWRTDAGDVEVSHDSGLVGIRLTSAARARELSELLAYLRTPTPGELELHGEDAAALGPSRYRERVTAPPHDAMVFSGTVRENLGVSSVHSHLVRASGLDDVLERVGGLGARVGEAGMRLSGGQRQRVVLSRALHAPADLLVLDDPTSALDPVTERAVAEGLAALERPIVVITASPILLRSCARVYDLGEQAPDPDRRTA